MIFGWIRESLLPRKFPAIHCLSVACALVALNKFEFHILMINYCIFSLSLSSPSPWALFRNSNDLLKPETLAYEAALRNELLDTNITEIPVST